MAKKITKATIKSFIKNNIGNIKIRTDSHFDSMSDCVTSRHDAQFLLATDTNGDLGLGYAAHWCDGRTWIKEYDDGIFKGFEISNCVGSYVLAIGGDEIEQSAETENQIDDLLEHISDIFIGCVIDAIDATHAHIFNGDEYDAEKHGWALNEALELGMVRATDKKMTVEYTQQGAEIVEKYRKRKEISDLLPETGSDVFCECGAKLGVFIAGAKYSCHDCENVNQSSDDKESVYLAALNVFKTKQNDWWLDKEADAIVRKATDLGIVWRRSVTQAQWTDEGRKIAHEIWLKSDECTKQNNAIKRATRIKSWTVRRFAKDLSKRTVNVRFPSINKNGTLRENDKYIEQGYYVEKCEIAKTIKVNSTEFYKLANSLMDDNPLWEKIGGRVLDDESRLINVKKWSQEELEIYRQYGKTQVVEVISDTGAKFYVNTEGYNYARYVGRAA